MISIEPFIEHYKDSKTRKFLHGINKKLPQYFSHAYHGDYSKWKKALQVMHSIVPPGKGDFEYNINSAVVTIGTANQLGQMREDFITALKEYMPWRKGPFKLFGIEIDCEWRSDLKWQRLAKEISTLKGRTVLDIGCGNGYHCWRQIGAGAHSVLGIDPLLHYVMQFNIFNAYLPHKNIQVLPLAIEELPDNILKFDTVFSMGVLYHRKSPMEHLLELKDLLSKDGEVILETLVIDGENGKVLVPKGRYAKMRNVWFIPSVLTLENWLKRCGFKNINLCHVDYTATEEQRVTEWMDYESLEQFLDAADQRKTVEGYPAPKRALFICSC